MSKIDNGGPAFPCDRIPTQSGGMIVSDGMTMRDYFAAKAMQSLVSEKLLPDIVAKWAYEQADAMLRAREANQ